MLESTRSGQPPSTVDSAVEPTLRIRGLTKHFGTRREVVAVSGLDLDVYPGEIFTLLGPSGCGKTTTLRLIGGLEHPDEGDIVLNGRPIASVSKRVLVPSHRRDMGMVFQSYAVWPHLTVFENVAYPLRARKVPGAEVRERVARVLHLVGLDGLESRPGPLLSGGQQQRVALARALIYEPGILLLDEPFSNLDANLREQMRVELKIIQREVGITVVMVTHDQIEALSLSDRVAVLNEGKVEQVGTPTEVYQNPASEFVRDFMGRTLIMRATVLEADAVGSVTAQFEDGSIVTGHTEGAWLPAIGAHVIVAVRPEHVEVGVDHGDTGPTNTRNGVIDTLLFLGDRFESRVRCDGGEHLVMSLPLDSPCSEEGIRVALTFPERHVSIWPT